MPCAFNMDQGARIGETVDAVHVREDRPCGGWKCVALDDRDSDGEPFRADEACTQKVEALPHDELTPELPCGCGDYKPAPTD